MLLKIVPYYLAQGGSAFNKNAKIISSFLSQMNVFFYFFDHRIDDDMSDRGGLRRRGGGTKIEEF